MSYPPGIDAEWLRARFLSQTEQAPVKTGDGLSPASSFSLKPRPFSIGAGRRLPSLCYIRLATELAS
jgi:hypothetical protein